MSGGYSDEANIVLAATAATIARCCADIITGERDYFQIPKNSNITEIQNKTFFLNFMRSKRGSGGTSDIDAISAVDAVPGC